MVSDKSFLLNSLGVGVHRSRSPASHSAIERGESIRGRDQSESRPPPPPNRTKHVGGAELNEQCQSSSLCSVLKWAFKDDGRERRRERVRGIASAVPFSLKDRRTHKPSIHPSILHPSFQRVERRKSGAVGREPCISPKVSRKRGVRLFY